jgi:hypothetical protein
MSPDLSTRIRTYAETIDYEAPPVTAEEAVERVGGSATEPVRRPEQTRRGWVVGLAAAAVACLVIGLPALFLLGGDGSPATTQPAVTTTASPFAGGLAWSPVREPPSIGTLEQLWVSQDGGVLAYGGGEIWSSSDGERWTLVGEVPFTIFLDAAPASPKLVSHGGGFLAVDTSWALRDWWGLTSEERAGLTPRLWLSAAGSEWSEVDLPVGLDGVDPALQYEVVVEGVVSGPSGILVVGRAHPHVDPVAIQAAFPDLGTVSRVQRFAPCCEDGEPQATDVEDPVWVWTAGSDEPQAVSLAALGVTRDDLWYRPTLLWLSTDGANFESIEFDLGFSEPNLLATRDGFWLIDLVGQGVWMSPDGLTWMESGRVPDGCLRPAVWKARVVCLAETATGTGIMELPEDGSWAELTEAEALGLPEGVFPEGLAAGDLGLAVIGTVEEVQPWSGGEPIPFARMFAFSVNGTTWATGTLDGFGSPGALEMAVMGDRVIAVSGPAPEGWVAGWEIVDPSWWIGTIGD